MMKKKMLAVAMALSMAVGSLSGCATPGSSEKAQATAESKTSENTAKDTPQAGQKEEEDITVTYAQTKDVDSLDPRNATSTITAAMMAQLYSALVTTDEDYNIVCDAAESYEIVDDRTYKFTLKKGILFHDGEEMTSEDVKYTMDTIREETSTYKLKSDFAFVYCEPIDDYTMYIKTDEPNASTLLRLNYIKIIPKHYVEKVGDEEFNAHPIGSGPYKLVEWNKDANIKLDAFEDYFGGKQEIDHLVCKVIPEASARIAALEAGEVDLISAVTTSQIERLKALETIEVVSKPTTRTAYFTMNSFKDSPVKDLKVRQAINMAIDREVLVKGILDGYGQACYSLALPMFEGFDETVKGYSYDPEKAKALLAEAGYPDGFELEMEGSFSGLSNAADIAQAVGAQLSAIGIQTTIVEKDSNTLKDEYEAKTTSPLTFYSFGGPYNNINLIFKCVLGTGERYSAWSDPAFDELLHTVDTTIDPEQSKEGYQKLQQYLVDEAPVAPLYQPYSICAYRKDKISEWEPRADEMLILNHAKITK